MSSLGRYEIRGEIGRGNMGVVYRGYDPVIDRMVAIKTITLPDTLPQEARTAFVDRFLREARIAGRLLHPNIVVTYDAATDEKTGVPFIVMELVEGESLSERLGKRGALLWNEALAVVIPLAHALAYAHDNGVVHRDIKPANVILTPQGVPKIADFGIAKLPASDQTFSGTVAGTPYYMSPEQLLGRRLDGRSDIFSLGVLLYSMIAGRRPFDGPDVPTIVGQVLYKNAPPISEFMPEVPRAFDGVLSRALEKDVERRYGTASDLVEDLLAVERGEDPAPAVPVGEATTVELVDVSPARPVGAGRVPLWSRFRPRILRVGLGLAILVAVAVLVFVFGRGRPGPELPLELRATHHHLIGDCSGQLALHDWGIEYKSPEHGVWRWEWDQIQKLERSDERSLTVETREGELLGLAEPMRYDFTLIETVLADDFWNDYRARAAGADPTAEKTESEEARSLPEQPEEPPEDQPTQADLYYSATVAFQGGDLEESQRQLEELLERNPDFAGAAQLLEEVDVQLWKQTLPLSFEARHKHRIGDCTGKLSLEDWGIEYRSEDHGIWGWSFSEIRIMERPSRWRLDVETHQTELLALRRPKSYRFELLDKPLEDQAWRRYWRLAQKKWSQ